MKKVRKTPIKSLVSTEKRRIKRVYGLKWAQYLEKKTP